MLFAFLARPACRLRLFQGLENLPNTEGQTPQNGPRQAEKQRYCRRLEHIWGAILSFVWKEKMNDMPAEPKT
jgi:hypothetical protein